MIEIKEHIEHAVLVGLITPEQPEEKTREYLDELAFLADTNKIVPVKRFVQRLEQPNTGTYVGEGKIQEIKEYVLAPHADEGKNGRCRWLSSTTNSRLANCAISSGNSMRYPTERLGVCV